MQLTMHKLTEQRNLIQAKEHSAKLYNFVSQHKIR